MLRQTSTKQSTEERDAAPLKAEQTGKRGSRKKAILSRDIGENSKRWNVAILVEREKRETERKAES